jgi:DNA-binding PadR family transcriptional regulator
MAVREALLALLADGPKHGYQLKHDFESATGAAWPLNVGQVYTTLQRLERDELVAPDPTIEPGDRAPDETDEAGEGAPEGGGEPGDGGAGRLPYRLTAAGQQELERWLLTPSPAPLANRDETAMRVLLALATRAGAVAPLLREQRRTATETLQTLTAMKAEPDQSLAWRLQLDRMIFLAEAELRWLDRTEDRLAVADSVDTNAEGVDPEADTTDTDTDTDAGTNDHDEEPAR